jgi:ubiquinol-cytochrome c reductase cytochrome b subunit
VSGTVPAPPGGTNDLLAGDVRLRGEPVPRAADGVEGDELPAPGGDLPIIGPALRFLDERTGLATFGRTALQKVFPDHWSFLLGEVAAFSFVILLLTGTFLTMFFRPDTTPVTYRGPYQPLEGQTVSSAFDSVMQLSFQIRAGLLMRQIHHWAALIFVGAILMHLARIFFTGAFRRPREVNWIIGFGLLLIALGEGFSGYSLPDDLLSGTGLRIAYSAALSIPFIGPWFASLFFGGIFPSSGFISRLFVIHVMLLPGALSAGIAIHLLIVWLQKHTQYRTPGATERNVIGLSLWPGQTFRSIGLFFLTVAVVTLLGGLVEINPVWVYGPFVPYTAASPAQPDYYIGWLEGLLRMAPGWQVTLFGVTIPEPFVPGVVVPGILFGVLWVWPFIEARITGDHREHNLLDWPWEAPGRAATGVAFAGLFAVLMLAGANDVLGAWLGIPVETLTVLFRILVFGVPALAWVLTYGLARGRLQRGAGPIEPPGGIALRRNASGGFEEVRETARLEATMGEGSES